MIIVNISLKNLRFSFVSLVSLSVLKTGLFSTIGVSTSTILNSLFCVALSIILLKGVRFSAFLVLMVSNLVFALIASSLFLLNVSTYFSCSFLSVNPSLTFDSYSI